MAWSSSSQTHEITFCGTTTTPSTYAAPANMYTTPNNQVIRCPVRAERDIGGACIHSNNISQATAEATSRGVRVCTAQELIFACGKGSGCSHDTDQILSSTVSLSPILSLVPFVITRMFRSPIPCHLCCVPQPQTRCRYPPKIHTHTHTHTHTHIHLQTLPLSLTDTCCCSR
jgi:hypothetical protein